MKIPDPDRVMATLVHMVSEHEGKFFQLTSDDSAATPVLQVLCPLCMTWCDAVLMPSLQKDEDDHEFSVPIGINMEKDQPYRPQLHVDITAHVHDHECNMDHFVDAGEGETGVWE